ncbi:MAG: M20 family metallopeptidase [Omnitrophica WOR_2 bacterium]
MMSYNPGFFAEKYQLALQNAEKETPQSGVCGYELEWNLLDSGLRPLSTIGSGPDQQSFVDYLRMHVLPEEIRSYSQLEVFHWMIEWATRPYFHPKGAVYESRVMEAFLANSLHLASREMGEQLFAWHGNLLYPVNVGHHSIPGSWQLAKRRYLERCVDLYGESLATAGIHTNLSLPAPLFALDFLNLSPTGRGNMHLDDYKSQFYITGARLMRAFCALFIATSASTPLQGALAGDRPVILLTPYDSIRNLTFPNPPSLDQPDLYRSYSDYLQISFDLVRRGIRFGNNNWTPVRARSFAEPVERLITITSEQLQDIYSKGLFAASGNIGVKEVIPIEEMAHQIEIQNLMARINLPMARVEIRTDEGGSSLEFDIANLTLKQLLLMRFYADPEFARSFRYDSEDIQRARRNEELAARIGLCADIENPFTGKLVAMRSFLSWTLGEVESLARALDFWEDLAPLVEMAHGASNTSEILRTRLLKELGDGDTLPREIPLEMVKAVMLERQDQVAADIVSIASCLLNEDKDILKLKLLFAEADREAIASPGLPVKFKQQNPSLITTIVDKTREIVELSQTLIQFPSVTACPSERIDQVQRLAGFICDYLRFSGVPVHYYNHHRYPALLAQFPGMDSNQESLNQAGDHFGVLLSGHFDVVSPDPDDSQFEPRLEGDYLWGRGAADMKTVVATCMVWMKDRLRVGPPFPPVRLALVGNEENGEMEPVGTPHLLKIMADEGIPQPGLLVAGERTGEHGDELWGEICVQNRGVVRFDLVARGKRAHSGVSGAQTDLSSRLLQARMDLSEIFQRYLTLKSPDGWQSQASFPFIQAGTPGIYNMTADYGILGVELRPIPQDPLDDLYLELKTYCTGHDFELQDRGAQAGIACDLDNPYLRKLMEAVRQVSGQEPRIGRKLPGTSARFAPAGQGVVWGQTGIGPHTREERHYIPSILPYYQALHRFADLILPAGD